MTRVWLPIFVCPSCSSLLANAGLREWTCLGCRLTFTQQKDIYRFLIPARLAALEPFLQQYRAVRARDGYRASAGDYYRALPAVPVGDPQAAAWQIRRETYEQLQRRVLNGLGRGPLKVLDLGAGNGWLSHRLGVLGHHAVAVDWLDDDEDGLGAHRHYATRFICVQADFDRLPFAPHQFDLVIFNGSLHYSPDVAATLSGAAQMLKRGGALLVMDSPFFRTDDDGRAMLSRKEESFRSDYGLSAIVRPGVGYLTFAGLSGVADRLGLAGRFFASRGGFAWMVRRMIAGFKIRRAPAGFGLWVAQ